MILIDTLMAGACLYLTAKFSQKYRRQKDTCLSRLFNDRKIAPSSALLLAYSKSSAREINKHDIELNRNILVSVGLMSLTIGGLLGYPLLTLLSIPGIIYFQIPFIWRGYQELFRQHKIGAATVDAVISIVMTSLGYFFASAFFFTMYHISRKILKKTEDSSRQSLINVWGETPQFVYIVQEDVEVEVPFNELKLGDVIVIQAGEMISVDGVVEKGMGNVDQHILTGEAQPVEKMSGDPVFASTVVLSGRLRVRVDKAGEDTVAAQIKNILNKTTSYKSFLQARGEQLTDQGAAPTLALSAMTLLILGPSSAATILLSSFGGLMRVVAPISVLNFLKIASEENILIKDGRALETLSKIDTIVFDKTGTLTQEQPYVEAIHPCPGYSENEILQYAAAAEHKQRHPLALAILQEAQDRKLDLPMVDETHYEVGYGLKVSLDEQQILVGSIRFMTIENIAIPPSIHTLQQTWQDQGLSLVYVAVNRQLGGVIVLQATIRPEAKQVIADLHQRGLTSLIISGDRVQPIQHLAQELGIDQYFAETLPEDKAALIEKLQKNGQSVCFVGDGINDSIALKKADVSVSLRGASTLATDTAQIILMDESLRKLPKLFLLADDLDKNMQTNFRITLLPGFMCVAGVYIFHIGVITAGVLYNISLCAGVANAMLPKLKNNKTDED